MCQVLCNDTLCMSYLLHLHSSHSATYCLHAIGEETEAQRNDLVCPGPLS